MPLSRAVDELLRLGGEDGRAEVVLSVTTDSDGPDFTSEEHVALREVARRLYHRFGEDGEVLTELSLLGPADDPLDWARMDADGAGPPASGNAGGVDGRPAGGHHPIEALHRFRQAVYRLFGGSVTDGVPPTVLGLLVGDDPGADDGGRW
jgi:hypothetical protein